MNSDDMVSDDAARASDVNRWIEQRIHEREQSAVLSETPPFPRIVLVEVANICNHRCAFCAYPKMTRPRNVIDPDLFRDLLRQAYDLGGREVGLYSGAEPLTCNHLEDHVAFLRDLGYTYIFISTNGTLADAARFKRLLDAGLSSVKFSINGGDRETYQRIHGKDDFDKAVENIRFVSAYRKTLDHPVKLFASFVEVPENAASFAALQGLLDPLVDEVFHTRAVNQSGQMLNLPVDPHVRESCILPFNQVHISREGYLRLCCNDYQNVLALEDLTQVTLAEAWAGQRFREIRRRHLAGDVGGTLCHNCMKGCAEPVRPLNPALATPETI